MPKIKFRSNLDPNALAFTLPQHLDTIYIPTAVATTATDYFKRYYQLSPEQAEEAAKVFLEEYYPEVLAHETAHLVLGQIAEEEGKQFPGHLVQNLRRIRQSMLGYHNPIINDWERDVHTHAVARALEHVFRRELNG